MAEYEVILEREVTEEGYIMVDAESEAEAKMKAEKLSASDMNWDRVDIGKHWAICATKAPEVKENGDEFEVESGKR